MGILQITLFGGVHLTHNNWLTEVKITREIQSLLAYLLLQRHREHPREVLAGIFWGEHSQERARGSLSTALWKLKKVLEPEGIPTGSYLISTHPGEVSFNRESQYWLDVEVFEQETIHLMACPSQSVDEPHVQKLEKILELYKGELLEGFYKDWMLQERERMRALFLKSLKYLLDYYRFNREYERGITYGRQILYLDPLREEIHRDVMRLYLENGQRTLAARQYEICRLTLSQELNISPMEETQGLYRELIGEYQNSHPLENTSELLTLSQAIELLRQASITIELTQGQVQQALHFIERYTEDRE